MNQSYNSTQFPMLYCAVGVRYVAVNADLHSLLCQTLAGIS
jgi:hypothetical protein